MTIVPDDKDWTWVLARPCPECGFDSTTLDRMRLPHRIATTSRAWAAALAAPGATERPSEGRWSPLEYACHVRDVHRVYAERVSRMLGEDDPAYDNWDQDATAVADRYDRQDPAVVATELAADGDALAALFADVSGVDWDRTGRRSDGATFTVDSIGRYYLHDIEHHVWDVTGSRPDPDG